MLAKVLLVTAALAAAALPARAPADADVVETSSFRTTVLHVPGLR